MRHGIGQGDSGVRGTNQGTSFHNSETGSQPYVPKGVRSPAEKLVTAMHPWLNRSDLRVSVAGTLLTRMNAEAQEKLWNLVNQCLMAWAAEYPRAGSGHPLYRIYRKAHVLMSAVVADDEARDARPRIPDERDADTAYWRGLAEGPK